MLEARDTDTRVRRTNRKWRGYLSQGANRENSSPSRITWIDVTSFVTTSPMDNYRHTCPLVTCERGRGRHGRPELGTILPTLFLSFFFAVDLLPLPRMEIHFIKLDAKFDIFSFVLWRVTLIVRFLRNFSLINDKSDVQHKFRTYQSVNIYLFQAYSLKHFSKSNIRKIPKIDYIKKKLFLLKDISKNRRNCQDGISRISRSRIIISKISKDRSTVAIIGCETVAKAGFQEVGRREQRNGKSDDNGVATSAFNALTVSLQAPPGGVRTVPDALFSKVSVAALQARGNGYGAKGELQDATSRHPE